MLSKINSVKLIVVATMVALSIFATIVLRVWYPDPWVAVLGVFRVYAAIAINLLVWLLAIIIIIKAHKKSWKNDMLSLFFIYAMSLAAIVVVASMERPKWVLAYAAGSPQTIMFEDSDIIGMLDSDMPGLNSLMSGPRYFVLNKKILKFAQNPELFDEQIKNKENWSEIDANLAFSRGESIKDTKYKKTIVISKKKSFMVWYNVETKEIVKEVEIDARHGKNT